jgi:hypothetical protein
MRTLNRNTVAATVAGAVIGAAGAAAGFMLGRASVMLPPRAVRRALGRNLGWMSGAEKRLVATLVAAGKGHLLAGWPPAGTRDEQKRALLRAAADALGGAAPGLEADRLALLAPPRAPKRPHRLEAHGDERVDEYYWLR